MTKPLSSGAFQQSAYRPLLLSTGQDAAPSVLLAQALAALVRNRAAAGADHRRATGRPHPEFGNGTLDAAARGVAGHLVDALPPRPQRVPDTIMAPDPTSGALFVHPHWESPLWAVGLRATALIGPYLFLTFPEHSTEKEFCHAR